MRKGFIGSGLGAISTYYWLTKPGIVYGNSIMTLAGFFLASRGHIETGRGLAVLAGTALVIAASCVFNNYIDRGIDQKMDRTKKRALVSGEVSGRNALLYGGALAAAGFAVLALWTNMLTVGIGLLGMVFYVAIYGVSKRRTVHGTLIGSVSGATPPVAGYVAVTNQIDAGAVLLFVILVLWQMPHFYAIAVFRLKDYAAAKLPMLPVKAGIPATKVQIVAYAVAFVAAASLLTVFGYTGYVYLAAILFLGLRWLWLCVQGFRTADDSAWARQVFKFSLLVLVGLAVLMSVDYRPL